MRRKEKETTLLAEGLLPVQERRELTPQAEKPGAAVDKKKSRRGGEEKQASPPPGLSDQPAWPCPHQVDDRDEGVVSQRRGED